METRERAITLKLLCELRATRTDRDGIQWSRLVLCDASQPLSFEYECHEHSNTFPMCGWHDILLRPACSGIQPYAPDVLCQRPAKSCTYLSRAVATMYVAIVLTSLLVFVGDGVGLVGQSDEMDHSPA